MKVCKDGASSWQNGPRLSRAPAEPTRSGPWRRRTSIIRGKLHMMRTFFPPDERTRGLFPWQNNWRIAADGASLVNLPRHARPHALPCPTLNLKRTDNIFHQKNSNRGWVFFLFITCDEVMVRVFSCVAEGLFISLSLHLLRSRQPMNISSERI